MSEIMPRIPPNEFVAQADGLMAWSPAFETIRIEDAGNGKRVLIVARDGQELYRGNFTSCESGHLAGLLSPSADRETAA